MLHLGQHHPRALAGDANVAEQRAFEGAPDHPALQRDHDRGRDREELLGAGVAEAIGLSYEMGAFIAGVAFASSPVSMVIAEQLKPLRDFFLILFFFSIGAQFNFLVTQHVLLAGIVIALLITVLKPFVFKQGFQLIGESKSFSKELGVRLGQGSEFSLLVAYGALASGLIGLRASYLIQMVVIITFVLSTYWVVYRYRTPISSTEKNRMD